MKTFIIVLFAFFGFVSFSSAQNAKHDLAISVQYRINKIVPLGKFRCWVTLSNNSKSDYKDIVYRAEFIAPDGTAEGFIDLTYHDFVAQGLSKELKPQYLDCPKDCIKINFSIVGGKKLG